MLLLSFPLSQCSWRSQCTSLPTDFDETLMSWLLLLASACTSGAFQRSSHVMLLKPCSAIFANLQDIQCSRTAELLQAQGMGRQQVALGFMTDKTDYFVSLLGDMTHIPSLQERWSRLWRLSLHCTASPTAQQLKKASRRKQDSLSY